MQLRQPGGHFCLHCGGRLHTGTVGAGGKFVRAILAPAANHRFRHFDMALQAEMFAQRETLVGAVTAGQQRHRTGRQAEGFAMPVETVEAAHITEPGRCRFAGDDRDLAPADFLDATSAISGTS